MIATGGRLAALLVGVPFAFAAAGWGGFSAIGLLARTSEHHEASYAWEGGQVSVDAGAGTIHIEAGTGTTIGVAYTEHYELKKPAVSSSVAGGGLALTARCPGGIFGQHCAIDYTLTVPAAARLVLHTGNGGVTVTGTTGGVSADTGNGSISLDGVGGDVVAHSGNGGISGSLASSSVQATSGNGGIRLRWNTAPMSVTARSGHGGISLTVPDGSGPYDVSATSGHGGRRVGVRTDPAASASITAHSGDGGVVVAYPSGG